MLGFITLFCGAGGDAIGLTEAGMTRIAGFNHDERAAATHAANFPDAEHKVADLDHYDMRNLPRGARVLWASPICTEASPAGGNPAPRHRHLLGQTTINGQDEPAPRSVYERTRATFYDVLRAVELWKFDAVLLENVVDVAYKWLLFEIILTAFITVGYNLQIVCVSSAHIGDQVNPNAPQWRDRIYRVLTRTGIPLPDVARARWPTASVAGTTWPRCSGGSRPPAGSWASRWASTASSTSTGARKVARTRSWSPTCARPPP